MRIPTTAPGVELHVVIACSGRKIRIQKHAPLGTSTVNLTRADARAVADAIHDALEAQP